MTKVNIHQARRSFPGSSIWLPAAKKSSLPKRDDPVGPDQAKGVARRPGAMRGKIRIKKSFDEPLPKELLASFAEKS
jgi:hypothetical protein